MQALRWPAALQETATHMASSKHAFGLHESSLPKMFMQNYEYPSAGLGSVVKKSVNIIEAIIQRQYFHRHNANL